MAGVSSLLTSIFNGLATFPVNTVHAALKQQADQKTAEAQQQAAKNATMNATKMAGGGLADMKAQPPHEIQYLQTQKFPPPPQVIHQPAPPEVIHQAPPPQIAHQPAPPQIQIITAAPVVVTTTTEDVDEDGDEDEDAKKLKLTKA